MSSTIPFRFNPVSLPDFYAGVLVGEDLPRETNRVTLHPTEKDQSRRHEDREGEGSLLFSSPLKPITIHTSACLQFV
jgi:hypothetical protein